MKERLLVVVVLLILKCPPAFSQGGPGSAGSPASVRSTQVSATQLIEFLNQTISWYHLVTLPENLATVPVEQETAYANRQIANQVVRLAFDFAVAQADAMAGTRSKEEATVGSGSKQDDALRQMQSKLELQYQDAQAELAADQKKLTIAAGPARRKLEAEVSELQGEIALAQARRDAVRSMVEFVSSSGANGGAQGLKAQIEALEASVPNATSNLPESSQAHGSPPIPTSAPGGPGPSGIWDLTADLFALSSKKDKLNSLIQQTDSLATASKGLQAPFISQLRELSSKGDQLAAQADTATQSLLEQEGHQLDSLAAQFTRASAEAIPLSKQALLLNLYEKNLVNQREGIQATFKADLKNLGLQLGFLGVILAILVGLAELWRRAVFRYIHDARRRHQFLLLRKFTLWFVIVLISAITLAGKLGSIATFAGLLTAGVALALQNVIVSVVGYFFLIGKFGIRVGDRVQASGTVGEVIDVGLVRFHLMELDRGGTPTGRVVALSNSIVFQPTAGLFKQIPGASFAWHDVTVTVPRRADFASVAKELLEAVEKVVQDYHDQIAQQYSEMEKAGILLSDKGLRPKLDLHLLPAGVEVTIRYPVDLQHAAEIDARVSRTLLGLLEEALGSEATGTAEIRLQTDVPSAGRG